MSFYWAVKFKSYEREDLLINEKVKEYIETEWIKGAQQTFTFDKEIYSYNSIDSIVRTNKQIIDLTKLLYAAEATKNSKSPMFNSNGEIITNWYKKLVTRKEYENYYSKHPSYKTLDKDANGIYIAFRLVEKENGSRPDSVEQCSEQEVERLCR